jgi:hypothetical protein
MNTKMKIKFIVVSAALLLASCTTEPPVTYKVGQLPDAEALATVSGTLRSTRSYRHQIPVSLEEGSGQASESIVYRLSQVSAQAVSVTVSVDLSIVDADNAANKTALLPMPAANVVIANDGKLSVEAGKLVSEKVDITFKADGLAPGVYLLPVVVAETGEVLRYYTIIRKIDELIFEYVGGLFTEIELNTDWMTVFYINTSEAQPLYADFAVLEKLDMNDWTSSYSAIGHIINMRIVRVDYNADTKRVILAPTSDIKYVLENRAERIQPMRDKGRKVCITIEGGGTGIGFCNMNDAQIADFAVQVADFVTTYDLDGINLFDEGSGYGKEGMPTMNTTSYPKLIKALREALGPDKLITLADKGDPTAYFNDTEATGGIEVGQYLDYAWHYYVSKNEPVVFCNPYNSETMYTQAVSRNPIAGLASGKYGTVAVPFYDDHSELLYDYSWMENTMNWGFERPNNIVVFEDLALPIQNVYESGCLNMMDMFFMNIIADDVYMYLHQQRILGIFRKNGYETWNKNW